jgi:hypothetical protein
LFLGGEVNAHTGKPKFGGWKGGGGDQAAFELIQEGVKMKNGRFTNPDLELHKKVNIAFLLETSQFFYIPMPSNNKSLKLHIKYYMTILRIGSDYIGGVLSKGSNLFLLDKEKKCR